MQAAREMEAALQDLPEKQITNSDAESVKGGATGQHIKKAILT